MRKRSDLWLALGLFALAFVLRASILAVAIPFDGLYGQDAYAYYDYAAELRLSLNESQAIPEFFWPLGYPLHVVVASWITGWRPLAGQLVSMLAAASIAALTFALTCEALRQVDSRRARHAGIVAALLVATAGQLMISSLAIMSDATGLAWAMASAWLTLHYTRTLRPSSLALAAFTLGIAVITRWVFGLLALPWVLTVLIAWRRSESAISLQRAIILTLIALAAGGLVIGAQLSLGDAHKGDLQTVTWDPTNAFRSEVTNLDGSFKYNVPIGLYYALPLIQPGYVFPLFVPFWIAGLWSLRRGVGPVRVLLIGWPLVGYIFLAGIAWQSTRFALIFFPPLAIWVGLGFDYLIDMRPVWRRALIALVTIGILASFVWSLRVVGNFVEQNKNDDLARVAFVTAQLDNGAEVITFSMTSTLDHYSDLNVVELFHETPTTLARRVCGVHGAYLYLDVANIEQQWQGLAPEVNYRWLRDQAGLETIAQFGGYTLFETGGNCS